MQIKNKILLICLSAICCIALNGCSSSVSKKRMHRAKWDCYTSQEADFRVVYDRDDLFASLIVPKFLKKKQKRLRVDFVLPETLEDIISIKLLKKRGSLVRLMKGFTDLAICGDFFVANKKVAKKNVVIFTEVDSTMLKKEFVWQLTYINKQGDIIVTQKGLQFAQN